MNEKTLKCPHCDYEAPESDFLEKPFPISADINSQYQTHKRMKSRGFNIVICPICYKLILIDANTEYYKETQKIADEFYKITGITIPLRVYYFDAFSDVKGDKSVIGTLMRDDVYGRKDFWTLQEDYITQKYGKRAWQLFMQLFHGRFL